MVIPNTPVTFIGSRKSSLEQRDIINSLAYECALEGIVFRSGHSGIIDMAGEDGYMAARRDYEFDPKTQIYIPWEGFGKELDHKEGNYIALDDNLIEWIYGKLKGSPLEWLIDKPTKSPWVRLFLRNICQIHGDPEYDEISSKVFFSAPENDRGVVSGGTAIAVKYARWLGVPTLNTKKINPRHP